MSGIKQPVIKGRAKVPVVMQLEELECGAASLGHAVGDEVIKETAKWLKSVFDEDRCYRYGGDEFLVLCESGEHDIGKTVTFSVPEITVLVL